MFPSSKLQTEGLLLFDKFGRSSDPNVAAAEARDTAKHISNLSILCNNVREANVVKRAIIRKIFIGNGDAVGRLSLGYIRCVK